MSDKKKCKPTTYLVIFWNKTGSKEIKREIFPMHLYTFDDVIESLKGKEEISDIYEVRYWKRRNYYVTVGKTFVWDGCKWVVFP